MSSPMIGRFFAAKRFCQYGSRAMKTGMQLMNAQPASRTCSTYHFVASSLPTGRYETTTSTWRSRRMPTMSSVAPGAFFTTCDRYLPIPSCVIPRPTFTPVRGTSAKRYVLFGSA